MAIYRFFRDRKISAWERLDSWIEAESYEEALEEALRRYDNDDWPEEEASMEEQIDGTWEPMSPDDDQMGEPTEMLIYRDNKYKEETIKDNGQRNKESIN